MLILHYFQHGTYLTICLVNTAIGDEFNDLERQLISVREQKKTLQKIEKNKQRTQMVLSMYASVTNIVPNLDEQSKISGYIMEKDKDAVEKFEYDTLKMTNFDICNGIWKIISE
ncbi:hypothetical protein VNO78_15615 [Psophocarpus tetragonolobus]|uniref:Kinetochore protein Spc24 n=1 Tax=Psophocarpus tetragonolobus TaxID=3891 RepID=A0AAN9SEA4_PSOTE